MLYTVNVSRLRGWQVHCDNVEKLLLLIFYSMRHNVVWIPRQYSDCWFLPLSGCCVIQEFRGHASSSCIEHRYRTDYHLIQHLCSKDQGQKSPTDTTRDGCKVTIVQLFVDLETKLKGITEDIAISEIDNVHWSSELALCPKLQMCLCLIYMWPSII